MQFVRDFLNKFKSYVWANKRNRYIFLVLVLLFVVVFVRIYNNINTNKKRAARLSGQQVVAVQYGVVKRGTVAPIIKFSGSLEPIWSSDISSKVAARVEKIHVFEGDAVVAGQIVAVLDGIELGAQAEQAKGSVYEAQANMEQSVLDYERAKKLYEQGAVSQQSLDTAKFKMDMAQGRVNSSRGSYDALQNRYESTVIRAPRAGLVARKYLQDGVFASVGMPIVNLADTTKLLAKVSVGEAEIMGVQLGQNAKVKVQSSEREFVGVVTRISPVAILPSRNFIVELTVDNADNSLRGGMFANSFISVQPRNNVLIVPQSAIVMREDQKTVYLVNQNNVLEQRLVVTGYIGEGKAEIVSGLNEGERIVTDGQNRVREGTKVQLLETDGK